MKIAFLIHNIYGIGGTISSTVNLTAALADRHKVEIVSMFRDLDKVSPKVDPRVTITSLVDRRKNAPTRDRSHALGQRPSAVFFTSDPAHHEYSALVDQRVEAYLRNTDADVVIATRPGLISYLARFGRPHYVRIGQEHVTFHHHSRAERDDQNAVIPQLDAFTTVSRRDADIFRRHLPNLHTHFFHLPNCVPQSAAEASDGRSKIVVAAGRLIPVKRYDLLIEAFAKVVAERPDWHLRLYGRGPVWNDLRTLIDSLEIYNNVTLMGPSSSIEAEWAKGSIGAVSSDRESFGMTIVEAMRAGLPVVSTDCPLGPAEIIRDGVDGLLTPVGDADAYAQTLLRLIDDEDLRRNMATKATVRAGDFDPDTVARRFEAFLNQLLAARPAAPTGATAAASTTPSRPDGRPALMAPPPLRTTLRRAAATAAGVLQQRRTRKPAPRPAKPAARRQPPPAVRAHAVVDPDGHLVIRLRTEHLTDTVHSLVWHLRGTRGRKDITLPVNAAGEAVLERDAHRLTTGRWDVNAAHGSVGARVRLEAELVETRHLVGVEPAESLSGVSAWLPYTTADGHLSIRAWHLDAHTEVLSATAGLAKLSVEARLYGQRPPGPTSAVALQSRGSGHRLTTAVTEATDDGRFGFTIDYEQLAATVSAEPDYWDVQLLPSPDARPIGVGRIGGDIAERKKTDNPPATELRTSNRALVRIAPYYTVDNGLAVSVQDATPTK